MMPAPHVPVELREFPEPALEPGSLLLRTLYSEVCGTDVHVWHGRLAGVPYPIIPGHVSVGIADKIRGDRLVFFDVHRTCGRCRACAVTRTPTRCEARRVYGITDSATEGLFGGCGLITAVHAIDRAALTTDAGPSAINVHQPINRKHLEIRGCWGSEVSHFVRALRVLERHHTAIPWRAIGTRAYTLPELNQALADAEAMRLPKALVKPN